MGVLSMIYLVICIIILVCLLIKNCNRGLKCNKATDDSVSSLLLITPNTNDGERNKDDLKYNLDGVNTMISNCDQKTSITLGIIGVVMTILLSSDLFKILRTFVFKPFIQYCSGDTHLIFSYERFSVFILLLIVIALLISSGYYFIKAISANIDYEGMYKQNPSLPKQSYLFFGTISKMEYKNFKCDNFNIIEDLKSQIYINSQIATAKFKNYNKGLKLFKILAIATIMLFISTMFI